jgi:hypothetical protein
MSIKLKAVYKLIPPPWYDREVTEENIEDLALFTGDMLDIRNNKVFINGRWRTLSNKLKAQSSGMACIRLYNNWLKVFYDFVVKE